MRLPGSLFSFAKPKQNQTILLLHQDALFLFSLTGVVCGTADVLLLIFLFNSFSDVTGIFQINERPLLWRRNRTADDKNNDTPEAHIIQHRHAAVASFDGEKPHDAITNYALRKYISTSTFINTLKNEKKKKAQQQIKKN